MSIIQEKSVNPDLPRRSGEDTQPTEGKNSCGIEDDLSVGEFILHYQPKFDLSSGRVSGFEALLRYDHPTAGVLSPSDFLDSLRASGALHAVERWVLRAACFQLSQLQKLSGQSSLGIAVNVSPSHIIAAGFSDEVHAALAESELPACCLTIEITENEPIPDARLIAYSTRKLSKAGVKFSLDDFGTGYSSIAHIRDIPVTEIKLDRSYVAGFPGSKTDTAVVAAIIVMAKALDVRVVAEGVEREDQLEALQEIGCDFAQGFLLGKPMSPMELYKTLAPSFPD